MIDLRFQFHYSQSSKSSSAFSLNIDTQLPSQGVTAIFGESGSGKTSLLRCIAGLERAEQGTLSVNGSVWQNETVFLPTYQRPLGYVFQEASLFPHLNVQDNLAYAIKRSDRALTEGVYQTILNTMSITDILSRHPHQLSGGERQRVAIARALLIQPQLLLMDEPLASLDTSRKQEILPYLEELRTLFDFPILYVSHALDEVARLADHVLVMRQGQMVAQGNLNDVLSRIDLPINLGNETSVVISAKIIERDPSWQLSRLAFAGGELWVRDNGDAVGQQLRVRIFANDISLALNSHEDSSILNRLPVTIEAISDDINPAMSLIRLKAGSEYLIARLTQKSVHHLQLAPEKTVWAQIKSVAIVR